MKTKETEKLELIEGYLVDQLNDVRLKLKKKALPNVKKAMEEVKNLSDSLSKENNMKTIAQQLNITEFPFTIRDSNGNETYFETSCGYWAKIEFDSKGKQTYLENSIGYIKDTRIKDMTDSKLIDILADFQENKITMNQAVELIQK